MHRSSWCGLGFLCVFGVHVFCAQIRRDFAELFEGGFEVFDNFLGENIGIGKVVGLFETFVAAFKPSLPTLFSFTSNGVPLKWHQKNSLIEIRFSSVRGVALGKFSLANRIKSSGVL
jgi:hypothetical protein